MQADPKPTRKFSRTLTNRMTIVAYKLFKQDRQMHLGFILYRLRKDFGFTMWEVANLTGVPVRTIKYFMDLIDPTLESGVLKELKKMDYDKEEEDWLQVTNMNGQGGQGYVFNPKEIPWFVQKKRDEKWGIAPEIQLGGESEKEYDKKVNEKQTN